MNNRRISSSSAVTRALAAGGIFLVLVVLIVIGCFVSPGFFTVRNLLSVIHVVTLLGIVAAGVAFITYSGHYVDLSIPAIMALAGFVTISALPLGIVCAVICGLLAGLLIGIINGYIVGYLRLNPIIWTLAMAFMLDGTWTKRIDGQVVALDPDKVGSGRDATHTIIRATDRVIGSLG